MKTSSSCWANYDFRPKSSRLKRTNGRNIEKDKDSVGKHYPIMLHIS